VEGNALTNCSEREVAAVGHVHIEVDDDGVCRSVFLREGMGDAFWPHFSVSVWRSLGSANTALAGLVNNSPANNSPINNSPVDNSPVEV
jgi:CHASE2 domain-containing sensor protein